MVLVIIYLFLCISNVSFSMNKEFHGVPTDELICAIKKSDFFQTHKISNTEIKIYNREAYKMYAESTLKERTDDLGDSSFNCKKIAAGTVLTVIGVVSTVFSFKADSPIEYIPFWAKDSFLGISSLTTIGVGLKLIINGLRNDNAKNKFMAATAIVTTVNDLQEYELDEIETE